MKKQGFLRGSAVLFIMVAVTKGLGLIYKIPLTAMLGGSGMSCYAGAFAVFTPVFAAAAAGAPNSMSRLVSEQLALGCVRNAVRIKRTAIGLFALLSAALTAAMILTSQTLAEKVIMIPQARWAVIGISLSLIPASVMNVYRGWAEGIGSMTPTASSEIAETVCKLIFGISGAYAVMRYAEDSFGKYHGCFGVYCTDLRAAHIAAAPYAAAAAAAGVSAASFAACVFIIFRTRKLSREAAAEVGNFVPANIGKRTAAFRLMTFAAPSALTAVIATLAGTADLLTIPLGLKRAIAADGQLFAFLEAYGIAAEDRAGFVYGSYTGLALTIFGLLPTFTAMLGKSALPSLTAACAKHDRAAATSLVSSMFLLSAVIALPGGLGVVILSKDLLTLFFAGRTAEISVCESPLSILGLAVIFMGIALPCLTALQACSRQVEAMLITMFGTALKLILNIILIPVPQLNISGAAISTAISQAAICLAAVTALIRGTGAELRCVKKLFLPTLPALLCSCTVILTQNAADPLFAEISQRLGVLLSIAAGSIICGISFGLLCISPKNEIFELFFKKKAENP